MPADDEATIPDAFEGYDEVAAVFTAEELPCVGFRNAGRPLSALRRPGRRIVDDGKRLVVEVADGGEGAGREAAGPAVEPGAGLLVGGTHTTAVLDVVRGTGLGHHPAVGDLTTGPGRLHGTIGGIVRQAREVGAFPGVGGVTPPGHRHAGDPDALLHAIARVDGPRVADAGSADGAERIEELRIDEFRAFTIGGAVLGHALPAGGTLEQRLRRVLAVTH
ncbi:hypothetical protein ACH5AO_24855 [Streptomyces sp. NPDC018964]|uniref:hypothetical protein n=1 Tax=Streptomyces sp. NPDC018964 TaxID=3365058 RepID=UPI0037952B51